MKKRRPWPIIILAFLYWMAPIYNLIYFSVLFDMTIAEYLYSFPSVLDGVLFFTLFPIAGTAIFCVRKWSFLVFFGVNIWNFYLNYQMWQVAPQSFTLPLYILAEFLNIGMVAYFLIPAVRRVYFDPALRWWEVAPRYNVDIDCDIYSDGIAGNISNMAIGGVFIVPQEGKELELGKQISMKFMFDETRIDIKGKVLHYDPNYLKGYGVKFCETSIKAKLLMRKVIKDIDERGFEKKRGVTLIEESIFEWFKTLITTGRGLFPKLPEIIQRKR